MTELKKVFFSLYMAVFMSSLGLGILSPILPAYVNTVTASSTMLGLIFGAYSASRTVFMTPVGFLSDRFGRRSFILAGLLLFTLVSPLYALASSVSTLIGVRVIQGIAAAMLMPVAMSYIGELAPDGREGFVMGSFTSAFFAGLGFGPLLGGVLRDQYSMNAAFYGMGLLSLLALSVTAITLPRPRKQGDIDHTPERSGTRFRARALDRRLVGLLIFRFSRALGIGFVWVLMPLYAIKDLGMTSLQVGILLSANTFLTTVLQSPLGHLSDRMGHLTRLYIGSLINGCALLFIYRLDRFNDLLLISIALGVAGAFIVPAGSALAVEIGRKNGMGGVMGLYNSSLSLGTMIGPVLGGVITDLWNIRVVFPAGAGVALAGWLIVLACYGARGWRNSRFMDPAS